MSKELFISSSPHETKVAVLENDQLVEVYYERDTDVGLVGGIYKGRVNRVLPGMQSAFVDIGLERDAFLYVSDLFLEDQEEYDKIFEEAEARATRFTTDQTPAAEPKAEQPVSQAGGAEAATAVAAGPASTAPQEAAPAEVAAVSEPRGQAVREVPPAAPPSAPPPPRHAGGAAEFRREHRGRRRNRHGRNFGDRERSFPKQDFRSRPPDRQEHGAPQTFEILPGESLAKYSHLTPPTSAPTTAAVPSGESPGAEGTSSRLAPPYRGETPPASEGTPVVTSFSEIEARHEEGVRETPTSRTVSEFGEPQYSPGQASRAEADFAQETDRAPVEAGEISSEGFAGATPSPTAAEFGPPSEVPVGSSFEASGESPAALSSVPEEQTSSEIQPEVQASSGGKALESDERSYTLREPYQRPRYAPRRGRRGPRGTGPRPQRPGGRPDRGRPGNSQTPQIAQLLKEGQEILVQIAKEPLGTKGARITSHVALPGRYLVYLPTIEHIGVSRKIASEQERLKLRNLILENKGSLTGGFIVRTAGQGRSEEEIKADLKFLSLLWTDVKSRAERIKAPALIHRDLDLVQRILRDILTPDFKSVRVDNETEYERALDFVNRCQPSLAGHVKLYTRDTPLFDEFGIEAEIEKALKPKVWLKSGGYIVINQTEALVAIDVNTGKYVGKTNRLEDTILKTNIDAVNEIVRQIRLRDLGGIIVIDFIDMDERRNRMKVAQALEEALRNDRAPSKTISFHDFGLIAMTRKRVKQSLERTLCERCTYCVGSGWIKSVTTVCYEILAEARKMASQIEGDMITLRVNPEVARVLKSREGILVSELESITRKDVVIKSDPAVHQERFEIF
ncbi:MAG: ribonuclease [Acidobacteria bacterium]|nr:MAG: ribonuclease [Acidobacteriota bacterium]